MDRKDWNFGGILLLDQYCWNDCTNYWDICWMAFRELYICECKVSNDWSEASWNAELIAKIDRNLRQQISTRSVFIDRIADKNFRMSFARRIRIGECWFHTQITILAQEITNPLEATMGSIIEKHHSEESSKLNVPWNRNTSSVLKKRTICDGGVLLCEWIKARGKKNLRWWRNGICGKLRSDHTFQSRKLRTSAF